MFCRLCNQSFNALCRLNLAGIRAKYADLCYKLFQAAPAGNWVKGLGQKLLGKIVWPQASTVGWADFALFSNFMHLQVV